MLSYSKNTITFQSRLPAEEFIRLLKEYVDKPKMIRLSTSSNKMFEGSVTNNGVISMQRISMDKSTNLPDIRGRIIPNATGCTVKVRLETFALVSAPIILVIAIIIFVAGIVVAIKVEHFIPIIIALLFAIGIFAVRQQQLFYLHEDRETLLHLFQEFEKNVLYLTPQQ